jgi:DNA-binding NtrC family response regulator
LYYRLNEVGLQVPALRERKEDIPLLIRKFARDFADKYQMPAISLTEEANEMAKHYYWRGNVRQLKNVVNQISIIERRREITPDILQHYLPHNEQHTGLITVGQSQHYEYIDPKNIEVLKQIVVSLNNDISSLKQEVEMLKSELQTRQQGQILLEHPTEIESSTPIMEKRNTAKIEDIISETEVEEVTPITIKKIADRDKEAIQEALEATKGNRKAAAALLGVSERTLYRKLKEEKDE